MEPTPPTHGGLSGFLAYVLWHLYQVFPFRGAWFGPVLFYGGIIAAFYVGAWPLLWRAVRRDMKALAARRKAIPAQHIASVSILLIGGIFTILCMSTYLDVLQLRRWHWARPDVEVRRIVGVAFLVSHVPAAIFLAVMFDNLSKRSVGFGSGVSEPYGDRRLSILFSGGGSFFGSAGRWITFTLYMVFFFVLVLPIWMLRGADRGHGILPGREKTDPVWEWPFLAALPLLFGCIYGTFFGVMRMSEPPPGDTPPATWIVAISSLPWLLTEGARMAFVYVCHRRTFG